MAHDGTAFFVYHTEVDVDKLKYHTDTSVRTLYGKLAAQVAVLGPTQFTELQTN